MHDYPLFKEMIDDIEEKDIKEINELLEKNDEFYLKEAIDKLERLIEFVKSTSKTIQNEYTKFDRLAITWEKIELVGVSEKELGEINNKVCSYRNINPNSEQGKILYNTIKTCNGSD